MHLLVDYTRKTCLDVAQISLDYFRAVKKWLGDARSMALKYPKHICLQMILILLASTLTMPVAKRVHDDFVFGFLRLD